MSNGRGYGYQKARDNFLRGEVDSPNVARHIRGWIEQEVAAGRRYIRSPPGYDVGHRRARVLGGPDHPSNFRFEFSGMNRARGWREWRLARTRWIRRLLRALAAIAK